MKKFTIVGVRTIDEYVTYSVEAETEEEALELVESGEIEDNGDHWQKDAGGGEDYYVQDNESDNDDEDEDDDE